MLCCCVNSDDYLVDYEHVFSFSVCFFFVMILRPPRSTRTATLFPYTTLFRSSGVAALFDEDLANQSMLPAASIARVTQITAPAGEVTSYHYASVSGEIGRAHV